MLRQVYATAAVDVAPDINFGYKISVIILPFRFGNVSPTVRENVGTIDGSQQELFAFRLPQSTSGHMRHDSVFYFVVDVWGRPHCGGRIKNFVVTFVF